MRTGPTAGGPTVRGATLSVVDACKSYGQVQAVDRVSLDVNAGEFVALLGPSGGGKTTTLRLIAGLEQPDSGDIRIDGNSVSSAPPYKRNIGVVFQHYALFPHMTVRENIGFALRMRRMLSVVGTKRVETALDLVGLKGLGHRKPSELSGGQQQRVAVARAIVFEPPVLLMDEPLAALDRKLREQLRVEIKSIQKRLAVTVVYITHDQEEALSLADRVAIMRNGRIEQVGSPREIYDRPASMFVAQFVGDANFFSCSVIDVANGTAVLRTSDGIRLLAAVRQSPDSRRGQRARYMIRPERVSLLKEGNTLPNAIEGRIEEVFYFGQTTTYHLRLRSGELFKLQVAERRGDQRLSPGELCHVGWQPDEGVLLRSDSEEVVKTQSGSGLATPPSGLSG